MSEPEYISHVAKCKNASDEDPRVYLIVVPMDENKYAAKPLLLPKKVYTYIMKSLEEANKILAEAPDPEHLSPATVMKVAEILSRPIDDCDEPGDAIAREKSPRDQNMYYYQ